MSPNYNNRAKTFFSLLAADGLMGCSRDNSIAILAEDVRAV
jgi:hypothetical protein